MPGVSAGTAKALMPLAPMRASPVRGHEHQHVGAACAADEGLGAVDDVFVATSSARVLSERRRSRCRVGQAVAGQFLPLVSSGPQWSRTLRGCGPGAQHPGRHVVDGDEGGGAGVHGRHFFKDQRGVEPGQGEAASGFGGVQAIKSPARPPWRWLLWGRCLLRPSARRGVPARPGKVAGGLGKGALLFGEFKVHGVLSLGFCCSGAGACSWPADGWSSVSQRISLAARWVSAVRHSWYRRGHWGCDSLLRCACLQRVVRSRCQAVCSCRSGAARGPTGRASRRQRMAIRCQPPGRLARRRRWFLPRGFAGAPACAWASAPSSIARKQHRDHGPSQSLSEKFACPAFTTDQLG